MKTLNDQIKDDVFEEALNKRAFKMDNITFKRWVQLNYHKPELVFIADKGCDRGTKFLTSCYKTIWIFDKFQGEIEAIIDKARGKKSMIDFVCYVGKLKIIDTVQFEISMVWLAIELVAKELLAED